MLLVASDRLSKDYDFIVGSDDYQAGEISAEEVLIRNAHEIIILNSLDLQSKAEQRLEGMLSVLQQSNVTYHIWDTESISQTDGLLSDILRVYPKADSIISMSDMQAIMLLKEAIDLEIKVPEQLPVIGYDDILFAQISQPSLSTISQPIYSWILLKMIINQ